MNDPLISITPKGVRKTGVDRTLIRLAVVGILVILMFTMLFSRLWFLQVLASDEFEGLARENQIRYVHSEPERGRILARGGEVLVDNRASLSITLDRSLFEDVDGKNKVLDRLARLLGVKVGDLRRRLEDVTVSPYKPVAIANDVSVEVAATIAERRDRLPGIEVERLPIRHYPQGPWAAQLLGYVGEVSPEQLDSPYFTEVKRAYSAGDLVGKMGLERSWDRELRGWPEVGRVVVNAAGKVVSRLAPSSEGRPGRDLVTSVDLRIQKATERALAAGIAAARERYEAPAGGAVVMDPRDGSVIAMASFPSYDPAILADGISVREFDRLGMRTPDDPSDDALLNRPVQAAAPPGSVFKTVTAGAAMVTGVAHPGTQLGCPPSRTFGVTFRNWTSRDLGRMGFARSLEVSCDTFYYDLGWALENRFGAALGDGTERFQRYMRASGFGRPTGIDLPFETAGRVPDERWCERVRSETGGSLCRHGWLPGYSVNMSIGQGDLIVSPLQMAVSYAALVNGGRVVVPRIAKGMTTPEEGDVQTSARFRPRISGRLPLRAAGRRVLRQGLEATVMGASGTARSAFAGFPLDRYPVAGKTGTAQIGDVSSGLNFAWFVSYAPVAQPRYVVAVYLERAGHGGESAAPVARQIYEAIFGIDRRTQVRLAKDGSG
jgi:penicillin-binding protein 2